MKKFTVTTLLVFLFLIVQSCKDDCEGMDCFTPPKFYQFNLVDKATNENIFTKGLYQASDITVIDTKTNAIISHDFIGENNQNIILLNKVGWKTESVSYKLMLKNDVTIFILEVDAERKNENCCSFTKYNKEEIKGAEFTADSSSEIYTILIPNIELDD